MSPDVLATGSAWLNATLRANASHTVTYKRGSASASVSATTGSTPFEATNDDGIVTHFESRDFLIDVADLEDFGEPERGDQVLDTLNGNVEIFEVVAPDGEEHLRYSDPERTVYRIHTKHIGRSGSS